MTNPPFHRFNIWILADTHTATRGEPNSCKGGGEPAVPHRSKEAHDFNPGHDEHGSSTLADLAVSEFGFSTIRAFDCGRIRK